MLQKSIRVKIPTNVGVKLVLAKRIYDKHQLDGTDSPLKTLKDYNWDEIGPNIIEALASHNEAETLRKQWEKAYEKRDNLMGDIDNVVKASRDLLKAVNKKNPHELGEWGFDVNNTSGTKAVK